MSLLRITRVLPAQLRVSAARHANKSLVPRAARFARSAEAFSGTRARIQSPLQARLYSTGGSANAVYDFKAIEELSKSPSEERILIDVREPGEFQGGFIPSAINIPVSSSPDALLLPEEEFEDRFGFSKPDPKKELIFYCKAGVRSSAAAKLAEQGGYTKIGEYRGSWIDWQNNGGRSEKP